jgi:DNA-binding response OmpR family regulator
VKPFSYKELEAHVRAMLRRVQLDQGTQAPNRIVSGDIELNIESHTVTKNGEVLIMRQKEFEILTLLMSNMNKVVTREQLFDDIWGTDWLGDTRTLDVHMSWLRSKIEDDPSHPIYLLTVRGVGYRFMRVSKDNEATT